MKSSEFATQLRNEVIQLTINGQKTIDSKNLTKFLDEKIPLLEHAEKEDSNITIDFRLAHYQAEIQSNTQMFASVLDYGKHALNSAMIINAGAAVALLSLIGNIIGGDPSAGSSYSTAVLWFVFGVLSAAIATGGAYCTQYFYTQAPEKPTGKRFHVTTVIFAIGSYGLFIAGALSSYFTLRS